MDEKVLEEYEELRQQIIETAISRLVESFTEVESSSGFVYKDSPDDTHLYEIALDADRIKNAEYNNTHDLCKILCRVLWNTSIVLQRIDERNIVEDIKTPKTDENLSGIARHVCPNCGETLVITSQQKMPHGYYSLEFTCANCSKQYVYMERLDDESDGK
jgi:predicted RNA-binding Zn-ribbon protein involved in translation (DUF1610 family)